MDLGGEVLSFVLGVSWGVCSVLPLSKGTG